MSTTNIAITTQEKNIIVNNGIDKLPLNPTNQGYTGQEVRRQMAKSITGAKGSILSLLIEKFQLIQDGIKSIRLVEVDVVDDEVIFKYEDGSEFKFPLSKITKGLVKEVNNIKPDENGKIEVKIDNIDGLRLALEDRYTKDKVYTKLEINALIKDMVVKDDIVGYLTSVSLDTKSHIMTFQRNGMPDVIFDFDLESLVQNIYVDGDDLVLVLEDGTERRVDLGVLLQGVVKEVNGKKPDINGKVTLTIDDIPGLKGQLDLKLNTTGGKMTGILETNRDIIAKSNQTTSDKKVIIGDNSSGEFGVNAYKGALKTSGFAFSGLSIMDYDAHHDWDGSTEPVVTGLKLYLTEQNVGSDGKYSRINFAPYMNNRFSTLFYIDLIEGQENKLKLGSDKVIESYSDFDFDIPENNAVLPNIKSIKKYIEDTKEDAIDYNLVEYMNYASNIFYNFGEMHNFKEAWDYMLTIEPTMTQNNIHDMITNRPVGVGFIFPLWFTLANYSIPYIVPYDNEVIVISLNEKQIENTTFRYFLEVKNAKILIPNGVEKIGPAMFENAIFDYDLVIPKTVTYIDGSVFRLTKMEALVFLSKVPPTFVNGTFSIFPSNATIYVPDESLEDYKYATNIDSHIRSLMKPMTERRFK